MYLSTARTLHVFTQYCTHAHEVDEFVYIHPQQMLPHWMMPLLECLSQRGMESQLKSEISSRRPGYLRYSEQSKRKLREGIMGREKRERGRACREIGEIGDRET